MDRVVPREFRTPWNYDTDAVSDETALLCLDKSLAQQSGAEECDINTIVEKYTRGIMPDAPDGQGQYGDFTASPESYHAAMNLVVAAQDSFDDLPAKVRARFRNDPGELLAFVADDNNFDEAVRLGLVSPKEDLSPVGVAATGGEAKPAGGKSGQRSSAAKKPVSGGSEGDGGDD